MLLVFLIILQVGANLLDFVAEDLESVNKSLAYVLRQGMKTCEGKPQEIGHAGSLNDLSKSDVEKATFVVRLLVHVAMATFL